jgi:protein SCO1/2
MRALFALGVLLCVVWTGGDAAQAQKRPGFDTGTGPGADSLVSGGPQDQALDKVRWEQKLGSQLPLDATFNDETGKQVQLGQYFSGQRPVVLAMVFFNCTMLCTQVITGTMQSLKDVPYEAGKDYEVVVVSINPKETPELTAGKKKNYLAEYGLTKYANGFHFLTGTEENIKKVTNAAGFFYTYDKTTDQFAHPGGVVVNTPRGKVARYLTGVLFEPRDMKLALLEAGESKIGSPVDLVLLRCFHYDPSKGTYSVAIMEVLRWVGGLFVLILGSGLGIWVWRDVKKQKAAAAAATDDLPLPVGERP